MTRHKILVTGATGDTGQATVNELLARGHKVRALAHGQDDRSKKLQERGVEVVYGDLLDFSQVRAALSGVQRAYFVYPIRPGILQATAYFAQAAKEAGVDGIVNMSQISARRTPRATPRPITGSPSESLTGRGLRSPTSGHHSARLPLKNAHNGWGSMAMNSSSKLFSQMC